MGNTQTDKKKREIMFKQFDPNGNGMLSLAEIDKGVRDILKCDHMFDAKPAIIRRLIPQIMLSRKRASPGLE